MIHNEHKYLVAMIDVFLEENEGLTFYPLLGIKEGLDAIPFFDLDCNCKPTEPCEEHMNGITELKSALRGDIREPEISPAIFYKLGYIPTSHSPLFMQMKAYFASKFNKLVKDYTQSNPHLVITPALKRESRKLRFFPERNYTYYIRSSFRALEEVLDITGSCILYGKGEDKQVAEQVYNYLREEHLKLIKQFGLTKDDKIFKVELEDYLTTYYDREVDKIIGRDIGNINPSQELENKPSTLLKHIVNVETFDKLTSFLAEMEYVLDNNSTTATKSNSISVDPLA